jgi:hypothetical protein
MGTGQLVTTNRIYNIIQKPDSMTTGGKKYMFAGIFWIASLTSEV